LKLPEDRKELVEEHMYIVRIVASKIRKKLPPYIDFEFDDLMGYGYIGLVDAGIKFDESKGYKFRTYASRRIHGAIIDGIRKMDWMTEGMRRKKVEIEKPLSMSWTNSDEEEKEREIEDERENIHDRMILRNMLVGVMVHLEWKRYCSLYLNYLEGYLQKEIAVMLGVSPSRISQLTKDASIKMQGMVGDEWANNTVSV